MSNANDFVIENGVLTKYVGPGGDVTVPEGVTSVGREAFQRYGILKSITIPKGVTNIGALAFDGCWQLTSITIPDGVTSIGHSAFSCCSSLTSITLPDSVTSIGKEAFWSCNNLKSITIPNGVTSIGAGAFDRCGLTNITIPDGVTSIGNYTFYGCSSLTSITIPDGVTYIGNSAFQNCERLQSIVLPDGVTSIGHSAFSGCKSLTGIVIPDGITSIESWTFGQCSSLTSVTLPSSVTSIEEKAFSGCRKLNLTLPSGLTAIEEAAFRDCALTLVKIPVGITQVGKDAFLRCNNIETAGPLGGGYDYEFPWMEEIPDNAFSGLRSLKTVVLPATIKKVGGNAFKDCRELVDLTMPKTAKVSKTAFKGCEKLREVKESPVEAAAPDAETTSSLNSKNGTEAPLSDFVIVNGRLLQYNGHKAKVVIPDSVTVIGEQAFYGNQNIVSVTIPASVNTIEHYAFGCCDKLKNITILGQIKKVEVDVFAWSVPELEVSVLSAIPLRAFTKAAQGDAIFTFSRHFSEFDPKSEVFLDNLKFIGTHLKQFSGYTQGVERLVRNDELRHAVLDAKAIPVKDIEWLLEQIQPERCSEIVAELLDYKARLLEEPKIKKALEKSKIRSEEKALSFEPTVAEWREIFKFSYKDGSIVITETKVSREVLTVPARIGTRNVSTIDSNAFYFLNGGNGWESNSPKQIVISEGIREIRPCAFVWVDNTEIFIPSTVISLPKGTFTEVQDLTLHLPASMTEIAEEVCWDSPSPIKAIHAPAGSYAESYAKEHNIPFVAE